MEPVLGKQVPRAEAPISKTSTTDLPSYAHLGIQSRQADLDDFEGLIDLEENVSDVSVNSEDAIKDENIEFFLRLARHKPH